jgi:hypothetical protein
VNTFARFKLLLERSSSSLLYFLCRTVKLQSSSTEHQSVLRTLYSLYRLAVACLLPRVLCSACSVCLSVCPEIGNSEKSHRILSGLSFCGAGYIKSLKVYLDHNSHFLALSDHAPSTHHHLTSPFHFWPFRHNSPLHPIHTFRASILPPCPLFFLFSTIDQKVLLLLYFKTSFTKGS